MAAHDPAWPDKVMSAALLVMMGGLLGLAFVSLRMMDATINVSNAPLLEDWPTGFMLVASLAALVLGIFAYIHQAWALTALGIVANVVSLGFLGISTILGIIAIWPLVRAFMEGEEVRLDHRRVHAHAWPDKAIMASAMLSSGASVLLVHGLLLAFGRIEGPFGLPAVAWGAVQLAAFAFVLIAARQAFHLRRVWVAWVAAGVLIVMVPFYVVGPVLGVATCLFLWHAEREGEFVDEQTPATA